MVVIGGLLDVCVDYSGVDRRRAPNSSAAAEATCRRT
jgi:hypothetical protein